MREEIVIALAMLAVLLAGGAITKNQRRYTPLILLLSAIAGSPSSAAVAPSSSAWRWSAAAWASTSQAK